MSIEKVIGAWVDGRKLKSGNVSTDGVKLYSWSLCIGITQAGRKVALSYPGNVSGSTTRHCNLAIAAVGKRSPGADS